MRQSLLQQIRIRPRRGGCWLVSQGDRQTFETSSAYFFQVHHGLKLKIGSRLRFAFGRDSPSSHGSYSRDVVPVVRKTLQTHRKVLWHIPPTYDFDKTEDSNSVVTWSRFDDAPSCRKQQENGQFLTSKTTMGKMNFTIVGVSNNAPLFTILVIASYSLQSRNATFYEHYHHHETNHKEH